MSGYRPVKRDIEKMRELRKKYNYVALDKGMDIAIISNSTLTKNTEKVLRLIIHYTIGNNNVDALFNGNDYAKIMGCNVKTISTSLNTLEELNIIKRVKDRYNSKFQGVVIINTNIFEWNIDFNREYVELISKEEKEVEDTPIPVVVPVVVCDPVVDCNHNDTKESVYCNDLGLDEETKKILETL